jgi:hypothetical protein
MATDEQVRNSLILLAKDARDRKDYDLCILYANSAIRLGDKLIDDIGKHQRKPHHD